MAASPEAARIFGTIPRSTLHLARMRAGLEPANGIVPVDPDRPSIQGAAGAPTLTWRAWYEPVEILAAALRALGLRPGDRVLVISETRLEWFQCDLAIVAAGGWTVPVYPTLPATQVEEILAGSGARFAFVSRPALLESVASSESARAQLRSVILMPEEGAGKENGARPAAGAGPEDAFVSKIVRWGAALEMGRAAPITGEIEENARRFGPDDPATLIYTSGTAGRMRGVVLSHGNLLSSAIASARRLGIRSDDVYLSFLPLSHVLERVVHLSMLASGAVIRYGEGLDRLEADFRRVRPTVVVGVPRLYEKILLESEEKARRLGSLFHLLFRLAEQAARRAGRRGPGSKPQGAFGWFWEAVVYRRVRKGLGGRVRCLISGGAPLGRREALFLNGAGMAMLEGYGLTETASVISVNTPDEWRLGSVGRPLPGIEIRIDRDGEILVRGPSVMLGYYGDERGTEEALAEGWLHTGDVGRIDGDGFLSIIDRKKDLIATSQGKKVAPQVVESCLRRSPLVREGIVFGERRPYLVALLFPDLERLRARLGLSLHDGADLMQVLNAPSVHALLRAEIDQHCAELAPHERVRDFVVLPHPPEVAEGTLTPTLKLRRAAITRMYASEIARLYSRN